MENNDELKVRIVDGKLVVTDGKSGNPVEVVGIPVEGKAAEAPDNTGGVEAPKWFAREIGTVKVDDRHPYVVVLNGVALYASSSQIPDRVKMLIMTGVPAGAFIVVDARTGQGYGIGMQKPPEKEGA